MSVENTLNNDEIDLFDLLDQMRQGWRWLVGGVLVGALAGGAAIVLTPARYEASALISVGQVGQTPAPLLLEPAPQVVERMNTLAFKQAYEQQSHADKKTLQVSLPRNSSLVQVTANGGDVAEAVRRVDLAVAMLVSRHDQLAKPQIARMRANLAEQQKRLAETQAQLDDIDRGVADDKTSPATRALLTSLRIQKAAELVALRDGVSLREAALLPPLTQPTQVLEAVASDGKPVAPRKALLLAIGPVAGLMLGLLGLFFRNGLRSAALRRADQQTAQ